MQWRMSDLTGNNSKKIYIDAQLYIDAPTL